MDSWRFVPGFSNYQISPEGLIRRSEACNRAPAGYLMKPLKDRDGYWRISIMRDGKKHRFGVHQLVALTFIGPRPSADHEVAHNNGVRTDNHYSNLRWATVLENQRDRFRHGTDIRGERSPTNKLSTAQIAEIRGRKGECYAHLGREYGVTRQAIRAIIIGKTWRHLPQDQPNGRS